MPAQRQIKVIDLFCGIGGLTHGLDEEGLDVVAGIDNDLTCKLRFGRQREVSRFQDFLERT
jgi:DNA (cytosine-5)-methyltransferase 1